MAVTKQKSIYVCQNCGYETVKWYGRCPDCGEWNTLSEEVRRRDPNKSQSSPQPLLPPEARLLRS